MVMLGESPTAVSWSWLGCQRKSKAVKGKVCTKSAATIEQHVDGQTNGLKFFLFDCPSHVHASPPTPPASATIEQHVDGHTNSIKIRENSSDILTFTKLLFRQFRLHEE
jgi:hypothetical protein